MLLNHSTLHPPIHTPPKTSTYLNKALLPTALPCLLLGLEACSVARATDRQSDFLVLCPMPSWLAPSYTHHRLLVAVSPVSQTTWLWFSRTLCSQTLQEVSHESVKAFMPSSSGGAKVGMSREHTQHNHFFGIDHQSNKYLLNVLHEQDIESSKSHYQIDSSLGWRGTQVLVSKPAAMGFLGTATLDLLHQNSLLWSPEMSSFNYPPDDTDVPPG